MLNFSRYSILAAAICCATAYAQDDINDDKVESNSWRENRIAECQQQFGAEQCSDPQFLEEQFHIKSLEVAHDAGRRRAKLEKEAERELTLQRVCNVSPATACKNNATPQCVQQVQQSCSQLKTQVARCLQNAKTYCASAAIPNCMKQRTAQCPSAKKQPLAQFFAKYPKLAPDQKMRLTKLAQELDAKQGNWFTRLLGIAN